MINRYVGRHFGWLLGGWFLMAVVPITAWAYNIESGGWYSHLMYYAPTLTNNEYLRTYEFYAASNDTVIMRVANEGTVQTDWLPDVQVWYENRSVSTNWNSVYGPVTNQRDIILSVSNAGVYRLDCTLNTNLWWYWWHDHAYSVSILRLPEAPLSYEDLDVGFIRNGEYIQGTINVGADLDAAFLAVSNRCTVQFRMGQGYWSEFPQVQLYNPLGKPVTNDYPTDYRAEITATLTNVGIYTLVMNDYLDGAGSYYVSMVKIGDLTPVSDLDIGPIISGETKRGTIQVPGDLDSATFSAVSGDVVTVTMSELTAADVALNPVVELFNPDGVMLVHTSDIFHVTAVITNIMLTTNGLFTIICKDAEDRYNERTPASYSLRMYFLPGSPSVTNAPAAPAFIAASDGTYTNYILVNWNASTSSNVVGYDLYRCTDNTNYEAGRIVTNLADTTYQDYSVQSNTVYYYKVKARSASAMSAFSTNDTGFTGNILPLPPTGIAASDGTYANSILVTWDQSSTTNVVGYDIWRSYWTNDYVLVYSNWTTLAYQDAGVMSNILYAYKVKARNAYGASDFSTSDTGYCGSTNITGTHRALIVGIDNYSPAYGPTPLTACTNDANGMYTTVFLADPSNRWSAANMVKLLDTQAAKQTIRSQLQTLAVESGVGDLTVFYQSSHGGQTPGTNPLSTFICTYNASYTDVELGTDLAMFRPESKIIIILDTCFSGGMYQFDGDRPFVWQFAERAMAQFRKVKTAEYRAKGLAVPKDLGTNIAFMTSSDYNEVSWEEDEVHGLYSGFLIQGCSLGYVNTNRDNQYSFYELHVYAAVRAEAAGTPSIQHAQALNSTMLNATIARAVSSNAIGAHIVYNDYDGDHVSDLAVFNPSTGYWRIGSLKRWKILAWDDFVWGGPGFRPINGDYDGDNVDDLAVYNQSTGEWRIASLVCRSIILDSVYFGGPNRTPVSGDYNWDGLDDGALYQLPDGYWYIVTAGGYPLLWGQSWTGAGFIPVSGDYNGDRLADLAMYHQGMGRWYIGSLVSNSAVAWGFPFGEVDAVPISGDYDGDGYSDLAIYQEATGKWYIWSLNRGISIANGMTLGGPGYKPVPGDYNGDGNDDLAVYNETTGYWKFLSVDGGQTFEMPFGGPGYIPVLPSW